MTVPGESVSAREERILTMCSFNKNAALSVCRSATPGRSAEANENPLICFNVPSSVK